MRGRKLSDRMEFAYGRYEDLNETKIDEYLGENISHSSVFIETIKRLESWKDDEDSWTRVGLAPDLLRQYTHHVFTQDVPEGCSRLAILN